VTGPGPRAPKLVPPGGTIGILGGGQLGRMTAMAAARLGYRAHVYHDEPDAPCLQVTPLATVARWDDMEALARFARAVDVVTLEWENIPVQALAFLQQFVAVHPGPGVLAVTQDRAMEKDFLNRLGVPTAPWRRARTAEEATAAFAGLGGPAILKTARLGYDGKGQSRLAPGADAAAAWAALGGVPAVLEGFVDFACEASVVVARGQDGEIRAYPAVENRHENGILARTIAPAALPAGVMAEADRVARLVAESLGLVGVLAVEMFVGRDGRVLVNELAPRPHNSGHWTIDACVTSQFEQLVRAACGLPLGDPGHVCHAVMDNLIGDQAEGWPALLAEEGARLHLYGKAEARPGRKMGHVTRLLPRAAG
jgi:5-(carboxyamino)imidazole ribonucleotide synthase